MKFSRLYVLAILAFLVLVFVMESRMPRRFSWNPSFREKSEQPFGCLLFDSVLATTLPRGYGVTRQTLYQLQSHTTADTSRRQAVLVLAERLYQLDSIDIQTMFAMAQRGNKVLLVAEGFSRLLNDTLKFQEERQWVSLSLRKDVLNLQERDTLCWHADSSYGARTFLFYPQLVSSAMHVDSDSIGCRPLSSRHNTLERLVLEFPVGQGSIVVATTPLLFTNYGILDPDGRDFVMRVLNEVKDLPVVRTTAYLPPADDETEQSPLRFFLRQPPLHWALYLSLLTLVAFMLFTARRRQRAIPVVQDPENRSVEFVDLVASLYERRHDYRGIAQLRYHTFAADLRRELQIDITDPASDAANVDLLARMTGTDGSEVASLLAALRQLADEPTVKARSMVDLVGQMNRMTQSLLLNTNHSQ